MAMELAMATLIGTLLQGLVKCTSPSGISPSGFFPKLLPCRLVHSCLDIRRQSDGLLVHGSVHFTKPCKNVPIKVAIASSIAIGFVFLIVYFSGGGMPPEK